ncbi:hypothetical protein [Yinghuangia seranimata]|uniref:hypothetical protein n=1 Tax=Yinghuangia seranimata TaxID=408067 RepID=UPI00248B4AAE|nr:hypothetical protein [Yinghuangia seranimata]MDI2128143.1 hypothetical protein [Yinghuangia seranimata]
MAEQAIGEVPLFREAFPEMTAEIVEMLRAEGDEAFADQIAELRYYGRCLCTPTCKGLSTDSRRRGSGLMVILPTEEPVFWLDVDDAGTTVLAIEVLDGRAVEPQLGMGPV